MARAGSGGRVTNKARMQKAALGRTRGAAPKRSTAAINGGGEPIVVYFDDIRLVRDLLGDYDANLAVLEDRLGVEAVVNGNAVSLRGSEASCATAKSVLEQLYSRLAQGETISVGDVVGAIRHARALEPSADGAAGTGLPEARQIRTRKRLITARTPAQSAYLASLERNDLVFATGPAGTGKTYLAVAFAAACLESGRCDRLILSRPAVEAGERLGFLPGDMREKVDPRARACLRRDRDRAPRLHARPHPFARHRHPRRGTELHPRPAQDGADQVGRGEQDDRDR